MLTLTRKAGEKIKIGSDIEITVVDVGGGKVRLALSAPRSMPILRAEVLDRIEEENRRAVPTRAIEGVDTEHLINFPEGLPGLREHRSFVLADIPGFDGVRALVSQSETAVRLLVVDAVDLSASYPVDEAQQAAGIAANEEVAVALVVTLPPQGIATVNMLAPIVIGLSSRSGRQVVLEGSGLPIRCELLMSRAETHDSVAPR
jgi:carbon storage regulator